MKHVIFFIILVFCCICVQAQDNSWYERVTGQENFGFKRLLDNALMMEIDGAGIYFPVFIKGRSDHAFVVLDDNDLHYLYDKTHGETEAKAPEDSVRSYLLRCLSDSIPLRTLNEALPWREGEFYTPVDSILRYTEAEKEVFIRRAFPNGSLDMERYDWATTILKLFQFGHITIGADEAPYIGFLPMEMVISLACCMGQDFQMMECLPSTHWEDSLCSVMSDIDYPDVTYVFCLDKNYYPVDFVEDTTIITFSVAAAFNAEPFNDNAHIVIKRVSVFGIKIKNDYQIVIGNKISANDLYLNEFQNIMRQMQYCYYITSQTKYKHYEREFTGLINITFVPLKRE